MKKIICITLLLPFVFIITATNAMAEQADFIKWVDFNASSQIMQKAYELDINTYKKDNHIKFVDTLAYLAALNGNNYNYKKDISNFNKLCSKLKTSGSISEIIGENKYFKYYQKVYHTIFKEAIGEYVTPVDGKQHYGIKNYYPIAAGYWCREGDDFGNNRAYGFKRKHLGHDMFGGTGTPIIAVEGGIVTELGWNKYGGWRIGISSHDNSRYYYYAHLRKDKPYHSSIKKGTIVTAGQVIGYLGVTGYSTKENKNMDTKPHLHFGLQLIFDESQRDGNGEIWIDVYQICRFLAKNKAKVVRNAETKDYDSINIFI